MIFCQTSNLRAHIFLLLENCLFDQPVLFDSHAKVERFFCKRHRCGCCRLVSGGTTKNNNFHFFAIFRVFKVIYPHRWQIHNASLLQWEKLIMLLFLQLTIVPIKALKYGNHKFFGSIFFEYSHVFFLQCWVSSSRNAINNNFTAMEFFIMRINLPKNCAFSEIEAIIKFSVSFSALESVANHS